jgi:aryl-phospho-beta-D-glucosidase BglC (GH1 family)
VKRKRTKVAGVLSAVCMCLFLGPNVACGGASAGAAPSTPPAPAAPSGAITTFAIASPAARGIVNQGTKTIDVYLPPASAVATLTPTITLASGATVQPASGTARDFTNPVTYTVTGADGKAVAYTATVHTTVPTAQEVAAQLGRGINMGNTLEPPHEGDWTNGALAQSSYFDAYKAAGFSSVRIPITWDLHFPKTSPFTVDATFMNRVDQVAGWSIDRGLTTVINAHHEDWIRAVGHTEYLAQKPRFVALWTQIATHFASWPPQLVFEILNEPRDPMTNADVNDLNATILGIIRQANPTRTVIIGANNYNGLPELEAADFAIPTGDSHLIATFHYYTPWKFCLQPTGQAVSTWGTTAEIASLQADLAGVAAWSTSHSIPVFIGEYGADLHCESASRLKWYTQFALAASANKLPCAAWEDSGNFGFFQRGAGTFDPSILNAIMGK